MSQPQPVMTHPQLGDRLSIPDADIVYIPAAFEPDLADRLFTELLAAVRWERHPIRIHGRRLPCPRLSAWYGDTGARYTYSGVTLDPLPWIPPLIDVKGRVERLAGQSFNSVLVNQYRHGADSMGLHADDEPELGREPAIASVSLGARRRFRLRHRQRRELAPVVLELEHGSLLIMRGATQRCWKHEVPKTRRPVGARVNLTFRRIEHRVDRS